MLVYNIRSYYLVEVLYQVGPESAHEYSIQLILLINFRIVT